MPFTAFHAHYLLLIQAGHRYGAFFDALKSRRFLYYPGTIVVTYLDRNTHNKVLLKYFHFPPGRLSVNHPEKQSQAYEETTSVTDRPRNAVSTYA
jgi:hypothetical protein